MAGLVLLILGGAVLVLFIEALDWTKPGPDEARGRERVAIIGVAMAATVAGLAALGGVLEGALATPETDKNQWGVGYTFPFVALGLPVVAGTLAILWTAAVNVRATFTRMVVAAALGLVTGVPAWLALVFLMVRLEEQFHP